MKTRSKLFLRLAGLLLLIACGLALTAQAQNREKYIISAKAGGINFVSGNVTVVHEGSTRQHGLTAKDNLETGDIVTTGMGGRVEVLLNPGSYMRVDENSEFQLADASLDNLLVKLIKGSAIVEVTGADGVQQSIAFSTPQVEATIIRGGIYRFNVLPNDTTEILVRKGRVLLDRGTPNEIKGGLKVTIRHGGVEVAKLDKKDQDSLDIWSKERAELLARANRRLQTRPLLTAFNDYGWNSLYGWNWNNRYLNPVGLWVYTPSTGGHCFLPIGPHRWSSPYGHHYETGVGFSGGGGGWPGRYNPQGTGGVTVSGNGSGGSSGSGSSGNNTTPSTTTQTVAPPPPPSPPPVESPVERGPRRDYTVQPN
jgi:hypothetical protein